MSFYRQCPPVTEEQRNDKTYQFPKPGAGNTDVVKEKLANVWDIRRSACEMLGISMENTTAGAPSGRVKSCRNAVLEVCKAWSNDNNIIVQEYLQTNYSDLLPQEYGGTFREKRTNYSMGLGNEEKQGIDEGQEEAEENDPLGLRQTALFKYLVRGYCHRWQQNGTHLSWRNIGELIDAVRDNLNMSMSTSAAARWLKKEKGAYEGGKGHRTKPAFKDMLEQFNSKKPVLFDEEPDPVRNNHSIKFEEEWYDELRNAVEEVEGVMGFGPELVCALASAIMKDHGRDYVEPMSYDWALWFLAKKMNPPFSVRKTTTKKLDDDTIARINELHEMNLDKILYLVENEGFDLEFFIMSDQFGLFLFPSPDHVWARKGSTHVPGDNAGDKRQITGNLFLTGKGDVRRAEIIYAGKSARSLPPRGTYHGNYY